MVHLINLDVKQANHQGELLEAAPGGHDRTQQDSVLNRCALTGVNGLPLGGIGRASL